MKIKYNTEIISGSIFAIIGAVLWFLVPSQIKTLEKTAVNAQTFPRIAIGGLFIFSVGLLLEGIFAREKKEIVVTRKSFQTEAFRKEMKSVLYAIMLVAYCFLITYAGFVISTLILVVAILLFYGARKWYYYAIPIAMVGIVYYVFKVLLRVSLP